MKFIDVVAAHAASVRKTVSFDSGVVVAWPTGVQRVYIVVRNNNVHVRLGASTILGRDVLAFTDMELTHGAITNHGTGLPATFTVGNYLRGLTSGATARILELVSGTKVRVVMTPGSLPFQAEHIHETTNGLPGGDTQSQADVSASAAVAVADAIVYKDGSDETNHPQILHNKDYSTHIALRAEFGNAEVDLIPYL